MKELKPHGYIDSTSPEMKEQAGTFDFILDTVSAHHDLEPYLSLLKLGQPSLPDLINESSYCILNTVN